MIKAVFYSIFSIVTLTLLAQSKNQVQHSFVDYNNNNEPSKCLTITKQGNESLFSNPDFTTDKGSNSFGIYLDLTVYIEGPFRTNDMETELNKKNLIPLDQPFTSWPWNWPGPESVDSIPNEDIVDWVLVDLRDATEPSLATYSSTCGRKAAFLLKDGSIVDLDGKSILFVPGSFL